MLGNKDCNICKGTGLIPFVKGGRVIPNASVFCECYEEHDHYHPVKPEDYDFSMSYDNYRSLCQYHGWQDPGSDVEPEPPKPQVIEHIHRNSDMSHKDFAQLQSLIGEVKYLRGKLMERSDKNRRSNRNVI